MIHFENMIKDKLKKKLQDILGLRVPTSPASQQVSQKSLVAASLNSSDCKQAIPYGSDFKNSEKYLSINHIRTIDV